MTEHLTEIITCSECKGTGNDATEPWFVCTWCMGLGRKYVNKPNAPALYVEPQDEPPGREIETPPPTE
jgi:DnaJ-class molecular chaperone